jgi:uncharacterized cupredoxin-like copper-binding protein
VLVGCGSSRESEAGAAAGRLYAAVERGDGRTACAQLSPDLRAAVVKEQSASCAKGVLKLRLHGDRVSVVRVYATAAQVTLSGGDTVFLGEGKQGWRVDALGCHPNGPGPYECEEQA